MLGDISQLQKDRSCRSPVRSPEESGSQTGSGMGAWHGLAEGVGSEHLMGTGSQVGRMRRLWR